MNAGKLLFIFIIFSRASSYSFAQELIFPTPPENNNQLFFLQRTPNTNTIIYELNYKNGMVDPENPVNGFWIRYQEKGQKEELNFIQRKFAYGIKSAKISENQYELSFVSYKKYKMYLRQGADKKFYVFTNINKKPAVLTRIFIKVNGGSFWSPNIEYVEITGREPSSRAIVKERIKI